MIRGLVRLGLAGAAAAYAVDRALGWGAREPAPIRSLAVIDASIQRVWAVVADIEGQPRWMREMQSVRLLTPGPVGVGTVGEAEVRILGIGVTDPVTITEFSPPTRFAIRHDGRFSGTGVITLEPGADGTTTIVRWDETLVPPLFPHLGALVQAPVLGAIFQADLRRLKALVETDSTAS